MYTSGNDIIAWSVRVPVFVNISGDIRTAYNARESESVYITADAILA